MLVEAVRRWRPEVAPLHSGAMTDVAKALDGRYRIERELGRGGMGAVYLARDLRERVFRRIGLGAYGRWFLTRASRGISPGVTASTGNTGASAPAAAKMATAVTLTTAQRWPISINECGHWSSGSTRLSEPFDPKDAKEDLSRSPSRPLASLAVNAFYFFGG